MQLSFPMLSSFSPEVYVDTEHPALDRSRASSDDVSGATTLESPYGSYAYVSAQGLWVGTCKCQPRTRLLLHKEVTSKYDSSLRAVRRKH